MSSFENLRIVDNFYQTSLFFPMPTVVISTLCEDGTTNLGPYSLVQPYYVAGRDYYAMLLNCRNSSNTAQNILRTGKCAINFINGVKASDFPPLPVDYGYRDSKNFWFHRKKHMRAELLPMREASLESVRYAAERVDDKIKFTDDALKLMLNVPRVFLPAALKGCVDWARENNVELITEEHMKIINDKRSKEKKK